MLYDDRTWMMTDEADWTRQKYPFWRGHP